MIFAISVTYVVAVKARSIQSENTSIFTETLPRIDCEN